MTDAEGHMTRRPWSSGSVRGEAAITCGTEGHVAADALTACSVHG